MAREITYNNFEKSLVVFMQNITTNHAITYTNTNSLKYSPFMSSHFHTLANFFASVVFPDPWIFGGRKEFVILG